jgi:hypothetical protein
MKRDWNSILKPAKFVLGIDFLLGLFIGLPSLFIGNPLEYSTFLVQSGLASRIAFLLVVLPAAATSVGLSISFFRALSSYGFSRALTWMLSLLLLFTLGFLVYGLSFMMVVLVAFNGW